MYVQIPIANGYYVAVQSGAGKKKGVKLKPIKKKRKEKKKQQARLEYTAQQ